MPEVNPAQVVIMGLVTVFIALICLIIIIVLLGKNHDRCYRKQGFSDNTGSGSRSGARCACRGPCPGCAAWQPAAGGRHRGSHC